MTQKLRIDWSKRTRRLLSKGYKPLCFDVCVDFDGTICQEAYPDCGPLLPDALWGLTKLRALGAKVHIYSCRSHKYLRKAHVEEAMLTYLTEHNVPYDSIERGYNGKPLVGRYFDDRAIPREPGPFNWRKAVDSYIRDIEHEVEGKYKQAMRRIV